MLSIILYGRNDNHGYNYHKRLALSLNCMAEMLSHPQDEIIYTDYNTPDELPTIIEAIQDTLTAKAKSAIRVIRVRPSLHQRFGKKTTLPLLEPIARNVAIRRSNPENKWILSTNADMIFVSKKPQETLTQILLEIADGFYSLPRFEIPERYWEFSLERSSPVENISFLRAQYRLLHLNCNVRKEGFLQFDNPGDFQLMLRNDIIQIGGFDEQMLHGWHVDSNLSRRMFLFLGKSKSLEEHLMAFHCNHTQKTSILHTEAHPENDWNRFVTSASMLPIVSQKDWGFSGEDIEEFIISSPRVKMHTDAISSSLAFEAEKDYEFHLQDDSFNTLTYPSSRILTFLVDHLITLPRTVKIAYVGHNTTLLCFLHGYLQAIKFEGNILCLRAFQNSESSLPSSVVLSEVNELISDASIFILDFGFDENSEDGELLKSSNQSVYFGKKKINKIIKTFLSLVKNKQDIKSNVKFIGINVNHTDVKTIFSAHLSVRINSFSTGISYGYLKERSQRGFLSQGSWKKRLSLAVHYLIVRYFFNYSSHVHRFVARRRGFFGLKKI